MPDGPTYRIQRGSGLPQFVCLRCEYIALSENQLLIHMQMMHDGVMIQEPETPSQASPPENAE
jgi:hypothetical protein